MRVLIVLNNLRVANGVASTIMNQYDSLVNNKCSVDFLQFLDFESPYVSCIKSNRGNIFTVKKNITCIKSMSKILKKGKYDIIHINQMNAQTVLLIFIAKISGIKHIIYHSHNTRIPGTMKRNVLEKICNFIYLRFANCYLACSDKAGKDAFGNNKFIVLKNAIDARKFSFNNSKRIEIRKSLQISDDTFVVGTVCRFARQKNPLFMIDIINEIIKIRPNTVFLWVGSAPNENDEVLSEMRNKVKVLGIEKYMLWVGSKDDSYNWYSAMDAFIMPSLWEGLGITFLESQANSLPTYASDVVPEETRITNLINFISLSDTSKEWANNICKNDVRTYDKVVDYYDNFVNTGYELEYARNDLYNIYKELMNS